MLSSWGTWHLEIKSTPGFEDLFYQPFCCLPYISSFTVGCVNMWFCSGVKPSRVMQAPFFHCILRDEILARHIDLGCWSNSYCALPHINPERMSADCTAMYELNNPQRWQQDHMCCIGQKRSSSSMHILLRRHLSAIFNPCLRPGASLSECVHHTLVAVGLVYLRLPVCV